MNYQQMSVVSSHSSVHTWSSDLEELLLTDGADAIVETFFSFSSSQCLIQVATAATTTGMAGNRRIGWALGSETYK